MLGNMWSVTKLLLNDSTQWTKLLILEGSSALNFLGIVVKYILSLILYSIYHLKSKTVLKYITSWILFHHHEW